MIKDDAKIEQYIYTTRNEDTIFGNGSGAYGVWATSEALANQVLKERANYNDTLLTEIVSKIQIRLGGSSRVCGVQNADIAKTRQNMNLSESEKEKKIKEIYDSVFSEIAVPRTERLGLKPGAVKTGGFLWFGGDYAEDQYEHVTHYDIKREEMLIVEEHTYNKNSLEIQAVNEAGARTDYRANLDAAPYRIGLTRMTDGRYIALRYTAIGRIYSNNDLRPGNFFVHAFIFPAGTEKKDIEQYIKNLPFKKGLDCKLDAEGNMTEIESSPCVLNFTTGKPEGYLPTKTWAELKRDATQTKTQQSKQTSTNQENQTKRSTPEKQENISKWSELLNLFASTLPKFNKDYKSRIQNQQELAKQLNLGGNLAEVLVNIGLEKKKEETSPNRDEKRIEFLEEIENELLSYHYNYYISDIIDNFKKLDTLKEKLEEAIDTNNEKKIKSCENEIKTIIASIKSSLAGKNMDSISKYITMMSRYLTEINKDALDEVHAIKSFRSVIGWMNRKTIEESIKKVYDLPDFETTVNI